MGIRESGPTIQATHQQKEIITLDNTLLLNNEDTCGLAPSTLRERPDPSEALAWLPQSLKHQPNVLRPPFFHGALRLV